MIQPQFKCFAKYFVEHPCQILFIIISSALLSVATDRHRWRTLAAHCPEKDWRI